MPTTKEYIKEWLKGIRKKYSWLAEQCFVSESSVKSWLSTGTIPRAKLALIEKLMDEYGQKKQEYAPRLHDVVEGYMDDRIVLSISPDEYREIEESAFNKGMTVKAYCHYILKWAAHHQEEAIHLIDLMLEEESLPRSASETA